MPFTIALVQFAPLRQNVIKNIKTIQAMLKGIHADLIVLPELANSGYLYGSKNSLTPFTEPQDGTGPFLSALKSFAGEVDGVIVTGYAEKYQDKLYNSAAAVSPNGLLVNYRKTHLYADEKLLFEPGDTGFLNFAWKGVNIGLMVCFDWIFPEAARTLALAGAQIIVHPANLVLPYCQNAMITRSIENRIFTVTANRIGQENLNETTLTFTGESQITNPKGDILFRAPHDKPCVRTLVINPADALDKTISPRNDMWTDRRPETYNL